MAETTANGAKISVKVIVDKVNKRVVYAEADYTFVDILFSFMALPLGTIARLMGKDEDTNFEALRSLNNLYQSLEDIPERYLSTEECKSMLLNPRSLSYEHCRKLKLDLDDTEPLKYFQCAICAPRHGYSYKSFFSTCTKAKCRHCGQLMDQEVRYDKPNIGVGDGVFVSDLATFIVTDDLCVMPYTSANSMRLLTGLGILDTSCLEDIKLDMGRDDVSINGSHNLFGSIRVVSERKSLTTLGSRVGFASKQKIKRKKIESSCSERVYRDKGMNSVLGGNGVKEILILLRMALSLNSVFTYLVFHRIILIRDSVISGQSSTLDRTDLIKKEESSGSNILLEVSLQKSTGKFLFAEAKEDFVDFLFGFLSIPLGTVVGELTKGASSITCMDNIFKSISNMSVGRYIRSQDIKDMLLKPHIGQQYSSKHQLFPLECTPLYWSHNCHKDPRVDGRLLKQFGMFIVSDDLSVTPSSSYSTLNTLKNLEVPFNDIEKYEISIGLVEGLKMLKASLRSYSILTDSLSLEHILMR